MIPNRLLISAIAAMSDNRVIGRENQLPWRLPADLQHFKALTTGHPVLMGRKTYESIGKPLPNRTNIILSRQPHFQVPGCIVVTSFDEALKKISSEHPEKKEELFIIGGADIYRQLLPYTHRLYLTIVHHHFEGDAYFPEIDSSQWKEIEHIHHAANQENAFAYSFIVLTRINEHSSNT